MWFIILVILTLVSIGIGIKFFIEYSKTKEKKFLLAAIILTFVIPGILLYFIYKIFFQIIIVKTPACYTVAQVPLKNTSTALLIYRKELIKKLSKRLPENVIKKISKK